MTPRQLAGLKAAAKTKQRLGDDFFKLMGQRGGKAQVSKGFGKNRELASIAGARGGRISRPPRRTV
jgi:uncharacterized protein